MEKVTFESVRALLVDILKVKEEEVLPTSRIQEDLKADSLDVLSVLMELESSYGITIPDEDLGKLVTVQNIVDYLNR